MTLIHYNVIVVFAINFCYIALTEQDANVNCPYLSGPVNGAVSYVSQRVGHIARYTCSTGYTLEGVSSRTCLAGGYWSEHQPACYGMKANLVVLEYVYRDKLVSVSVNYVILIDV